MNDRLAKYYVPIKWGLDRNIASYHSNFPAIIIVVFTGDVVWLLTKIRDFPIDLQVFIHLLLEHEHSREGSQDSINSLRPSDAYMRR